MKVTVEKCEECEKEILPTAVLYDLQIGLTKVLGESLDPVTKVVRTRPHYTVTVKRMILCSQGCALIQFKKALGNGSDQHHTR